MKLIKIYGYDPNTMCSFGGNFDSFDDAISYLSGPDGLQAKSVGGDDYIYHIIKSVVIDGIKFKMLNKCCTKCTCNEAIALLTKKKKSYKKGKPTSVITITEAVKNSHLKIFKPGYPTGRCEYLIKTADQSLAKTYFSKLGFDMMRVHCGHDYNYDGDLYKIVKKN